MCITLNSKNKFGFVDGSIAQPAETNPMAGALFRCNNMVLSWLLNAMAKDIVDSLLYLDSARAVWVDFHDRFQQTNTPRIFQLKQMMNSSMQGALNVNSYYTRMKMLWDELKTCQPTPVCCCGGMKAWNDYMEQEFVMLFLMGLKDSYTSIRSQILMMETPPSISKVFSLVIQEERHWVVRNAIGTETFNGAMESANVALTQGGRRRPTCTHCGLLGHIVVQCYKLHGYPPGYWSKSKGTSSPSATTKAQQCGSSLKPVGLQSSSSPHVSSTVAPTCSTSVPSATSSSAASVMALTTD
ncbi:uncharacterized protein LOC110807883 [Carica papaya]|uniref:uncharacterized protein LOC110807883 n=1 Tax=Carica papaya TaxID=3649 RepID=UPI000B8CE202|nr:uncharacterized protein LOC110807883 [Carica papaya]